MANEFKVRKGLIVQGSGSIILDIQGSQGELFSVTDSLSGSLFSVNDISGIPIMEVFSDNIIKMGTFNQEAIIVSGSRTGMGIATPQAELHISGANNDSLLRIQSPASASIMFVSGSGNVGLGTLTPTATLEIASTGSATLGQAQIYLNAAAVGRNRIDFNTNGLGVPATTTRSDGTKITLYPAISATNTDIALGVAFPLGVGEFWSSVYNSSISFSWYAAATQIMRLVGDGQLRLGAGTAALPVISAGLSGTDTNTGIYFPTADTIGLVTGGTERARITSAGSASIGTITSTPSATLHVSGANANILLRIASPGSADSLVVSGSGNVGIGLASPLARLHISGANALRMQNTGFDTFEWFFNAGTGIGFRNITDGTTPFFVGGTDDIGIGTTNTSARLHVSGASNSNLLRVGSPAQANILFITGSGNIGVGTTTPGVTLDVVGQIRASTTMFNNTTQTNIIQLSSATNLQFLSASVETARYDNNGWGFFNTAPTARVHISGADSANLFRVSSPSATNALFVSGSGNVGIGTNLPSADLHISGASADSLLRVGSPTDSNILFITGSGNVGIGTSAPNAKLHISSSGGYQLRVAASASFSSSLMVSGSFGFVGIGVESPQSILHVNDRPEFNNVTGNVPVAFFGNYQNITTFYNNNNQDNTVLGEPAAWMNIKCDGTEYLIPLYTS